MNARSQTAVLDALEQALDMPAARRRSYLDRTCAGDHALRRELESLLAADAQSSGFLEPVLSQNLGKTPLGDELPQRLGHYRLDQLLGVGAMGRVFLAYDLALDRPAAIKLLREAYSPWQKSCLLREAEASAHLQHPAIATFFESGEIDGVAYIAMEYVPGPTLRHCIQRGPHPIETALRLVLTLLEALVHAHAAGLLHRDIKPENIVVNGPGCGKLLDFGLAKTLVSTSSTEHPRGSSLSPETSFRAGTPGYMSPEQWKGHRVGPESDLFAMGAVLYETLSGRPAFPGSSLQECGIERPSQTYPPPPIPGLPSKLSAVIGRALKQDPSDRYKTATKMLSDLRQAADRLESCTPCQQGSSTPTSDPPPCNLQTAEGEICRRAWFLTHHPGKGNLDQAAELFEQASRQNPTHGPAWVGLAAVHALRFTYSTRPMDLEKAEKFARRAATADPRCSDAQGWLGYCEIRKNSLEEAIRILTRTTRLDDQNFLTHYFAAMALEWSNRPEEAVAYYQASLRLNPDMGMNNLGLGWCHFQLGRREEAHWCLSRASRLEQNRMAVCAGVDGFLGEFLRSTGRPVEGKERSLVGLEAVEQSDFMYRDSFRGVCLCTLGRASLQLGESDAAAAAFQQAQLHVQGRSNALGGGHLIVQALAGLARVRHDLAAFEEACTLFEQRSQFSFHLLWTCTDPYTLAQLARTARGLGLRDQALHLATRSRIAYSRPCVVSQETTE